VFYSIRIANERHVEVLGQVALLHGERRANRELRHPA
jgi:hypothetical protein